MPELPWQKARSFLLEKGVRDQLMHFDAHSITPHIRQQVRVAAPGPIFVSPVLCAWACAVRRWC